jgi:glycosyltransferase involved in cell wall biosynthesis
MIEAMACGTPVVGYRHGAAPEVVDDGVTGYLVDTEDEAVLAVPLAQALDRREIRRRFDRRFSATTMARGYLDLYARGEARGALKGELASERPRADKAASLSNCL